MSTLKSSAEDLTLNADGSGNDIKFQSNGVEKASIDQDGNVVAAGTISSTGDTTITTGDIVFATAGKGVCLGVTTNTDSNTLDDYEEGTWTPSVGGDATYNTQTGKYTKVGNMITLVLEMNINVLGTGSTTTISGAPFTPISGTHTASAPIGYAANLATNCIGLYFRMDAGNAQIHNATLNSAAATTSTGTAIFGNSARVLFSITYLTTT